MANNLPFKYSIVKFNHDIVRGEPVNIAILLLSINENRYYIKTILDEDYELINSSKENRLLINGILRKLKKYISNLNYDLTKLQQIYENYNKTIEFTELRGILADNYSAALESLYERYIGIGNFAIRNKLKNSYSLNLPIQLTSTISKDESTGILEAALTYGSDFYQKYYTSLSLTDWETENIKLLKVKNKNV